MRKRLFIALLFAVILSQNACGNSESTDARMTKIQAAISAASKITAVADIRADYADRVYDFQVRFTGTEAAGEIAIQKPESLAGVTVRVSDNGAKLIYDGAELETGELGNDLSPVGIIPMLINEWKKGFTDFTVKEKHGMLTMSTTLPGGAIQKTWFEDENNLPKRTEVVASGRTVLTVEFYDVIYE